MSSDLFVFDSSFFDDTFSAFNSDSPIETLQSIPIPIPIPDNNETSADEIDQIVNTLLSSSPPSHQLGSLSISKTTHSGVASNSPNGFFDFSVFEVKTEECQLPSFHSTHDYNNHDSTTFLPHSYGGSDNALQMMQRSFSSNCFDGKPNLLFQPRFDSLVESPNSGQTIPQVLSSPESCFSSGQMRRVCSTGDLHSTKTNHSSNRLSSSPLAIENSFIEEANPKIGRYSAEERKERIHRYRAKRNQRNFNKTIKYACRKTLADSRPRIRGRFARNDELGELPKTNPYNRYEDEDELWIEGFQEDEGEETTVGRVPLFSSSYGTSHDQFQYYGCS